MTGRVALQGSTRTGQPLMVLGAILLLWAAARALFWQSPFPLVLPPLPELDLGNRQFSVGHDPALSFGRGAERGLAVPGPAPVGTGLSGARATLALAAPEPAAFYDETALASRGQPLLASTAHQLMWLAAHEPLPTAVRRQATETRAEQAATPLSLLNPPAAVGRPQRWSASGWAFLRQGSAAAPALSSGVPAYGASQVGAVLAYRLAPGATRQGAAYLRVTAALDRPDEVEMALGLSARPMPQLPVAAMAEGRVRRSGDAVVLRPAVLAVTQLPRLDLAHGFVAEAYGQVGFVGGPDATGFADGQMRVMRDLAQWQPGHLRAGAGVWGGAQKGASRLDIGPTAQLDVALADVPARLAVDYRTRVAGNAAPGSGFALTLSTGF